MNAEVELHYLEAHPDLLFERLRRRGMEAPAITRDDFSKWADVFQEPKSDELELFDDARVIDQHT